MNRFFLIDAMALIYRAYFALQKNPRITSYGKNTNASFGFTNTLLDILKNQHPTHIAVAFDSYEPTERKEAFNAYKANRQSAPEELVDSLEDIKEIIRGFNIPIFEEGGYEADDIIGTIALHFEAKADIEVYMVTPDKDYGQIVRPNIFMLKPPFMGKGFEKMTEQDVCDKWGLQSVHQVIDMLALMGDSSDNIPGIPGIGEKTASKLLGTYHTLDNILDKADQIAGSVGEKIRQGKESALMSKYLATIITDVPVHYTLEDCQVKPYNYEKLSAIFKKLEFQNIAKRVLPQESLHTPPPSPNSPSLFEEEGEDNDNTPPQGEHIKTIHEVAHQYHLVSDVALLQLLLSQIQKSSVVCIDTETTGLNIHRDRLVGISISLEPFEAYYIDLNRPEVRDEFLPLIQSALNGQEKLWVGHNLKFDYLILKHAGIELRGRFFDTMVAKYVLGDAGKKSMDAMSVQYLHYQPIAYHSLVDEKQGIMNLSDVEASSVKDYAAEDADITLQLYHHLSPIIRQKNLSDILEKVESPLITVLAEMEETGVKIDGDFLLNYSKELEAELNIIEENIYAHSGVVFNISSPKQLGEILFEKMKLKSIAQKSKSKQHATGEEVLSKLVGEHLIIEEILAYREIAKLKSTYVDTFPKLIEPSTGRVHTSYNQTVAVTGRLSSQNPNLQNIPIRTERGKKIRQAFIATNEDYVLLSADYSQIELRVMAAMSHDEQMCRAFIDDQDIHAATAAAVYQVSQADITPEMRYRAKSVNFGIIYGQQAWGLSESLGISVAEAKELIESYFRQYPGIKRYMQEQIAFAKKNGFVQTLMGRVRYLDNILSKNATVRGFAERNAINTPIQGTAADMIKLAMIDIHHYLKAQKMKSKLILQVHDELVIDTHQSEIEQVKAIVADKMINALPLPNNVPVKISMDTGRNWLESH